MCHSVHRGISFQACITGHMTGDLHPGGSPFEGSAPTGVCIQEGLGRPHLVCIGGGLGRPSSQDTWDTTGYVNKRAVRIRLECFLVYCGLTSVIYIESFLADFTTCARLYADVRTMSADVCRYLPMFEDFLLLLHILNKFP